MGDYARAFELARPAAQAGDPLAQSVLGTSYRLGLGVKQDDAEAEKWFASALKLAMPAAEKGDAKAQFVAAVAYYNGMGVAEDAAAGVAWTRKSAEQGYAIAQFALAGIYREGKGIAKDEKQSVVWLRKAAENGYAAAQFGLGYLYLSGQGGAAADAFQGAAWVRKAADQGMGQAQYLLGALYESSDEAKSFYWYRKAADRGFIPPERADHKPSNLWNQALAESKRTVAEAERVGAASNTKAEREPPALASDVDRPTYALAQDSDAFALVVGIENYSDLPPAEFAERDAEAVKNHLMALGYPSRNVIHLSGPKAGKAAIEKYLEQWLPRQVKADSRVFFYFSGHGAPDPKTGIAYLVPWDGDSNFLETTGYPIKRLYSKLGALKAKEIYVAMDACFSGAGGRSVLPRGARPLVTKVDMGDAPQGKLTVFAAASAEQITSTLHDQGHGTFTYYFLKGLSGAAKDGSSSVTTLGLFRYLKSKVEDAAQRQNRDQNPVIQGAQQDKEIVRFR